VQLTLNNFNVFPTDLRIEKYNRSYQGALLYICIADYSLDLMQEIYDAVVQNGLLKI
jgi:hypothetical protein